MRKIIPFKKEIRFQTKIMEVCSISLEHDYSVNDDVISGNFIVSGEYKIMTSSIEREPFNYDIPFEIALDSRYDTDSISLDIDNFYYEVINDDTLKVSIDVMVSGEYIDVPLFEEVSKVSSSDSDFFSDRDVSNVLDKDSSNVIDKDDSTTFDKVIDKDDSATFDKVNLFDNINMDETYSVYRVYIVKDGDSVESIINKYKISYDDLVLYNDLSMIKPMDKIIIPSVNE